MNRILVNSSLSILLAFAAACAADSASQTASASQARSEVGSASGPALRLRQPGPATPASARAQEAEDSRVVANLIDLARRDNRVQEHLRHLCLAIGPRLTSSHNLATAQQWTLEQFRTWGLEANLEKWGEFAVGFDRGPFRGGIVGDDSVQFEFTTSSWTPGTEGPARARAVLKPDTEAQLTEVEALLPGAWLVVRSYARGGPARPDVTKEIKDKIAAAITAAGVRGEIRTSGGELVHTGGNHAIKWDKLPKSTRISLRGDQYKDLVARIEKGDPVEVEFDIDNRFYEGPVPQYNVIADIRGSELPDEYVIVGGHLDSWDGAQGAVDNGTGCATTLEAARLLIAVGARPKRTIRFALWSGEEQGLFGSVGYVRDHQAELDRISAVYIHDGGTNYLSGLGVTIDMEDQMRKVCAPLFGLNPEMPFKLRVTEGMQYRGDSDHGPFCEAGVPGFFWDQSGKSDYNHMHHTQNDTFETAVPEYQMHSALVAAITAFHTANLPQLLNRGNFEPLPQRRMGVVLDGTKLGSVTKGGKAEVAGWQVGDEVISIDGVAIATRDEVTGQLQQGGPKKLVVLRRGAATITSLLDYSGNKDEEERIQRAEMREARKLGQQKKFW